MDPTWLTVIEKFGWPGAFAIACAFVIWRFSKWCAPRVDKAIDAHNQFLDRMAASQEGIGPAIAKNTTVLEQNTDAVTSLSNLVQQNLLQSRHHAQQPHKNGGTP